MLENIENMPVRNQQGFTAYHGPGLKLNAFLQKIKAPLYAYDELMKLLCEISQDNYKFTHDFLTRRRLIDMLHTRYNSFGTCPKLVNVQLESGDVVSVVVFDFYK